MKIRTIDDLNKIKENAMRLIFPDEGKIVVGMATCGLATGSLEVFTAISKEKESQDVKMALGKTGCLGFCQVEPTVEVRTAEGERYVYQTMNPEKVTALLAELSTGNMPTKWLLGKISKDGQTEINFYKKQNRLILANCGFIDPESIEEYIATGGYFPLRAILSQSSPQQVIDEIKKSGLRGRGGGGFPTGVKWEATRKAKGEPKYVICNADEGDPGAYMDRSLLEGNPHAVLEGMIIGAYAIGSSQGYVYVRNEYPLAVKNIGLAIEQAKEYGLLGEDIMGSGFNFDLKIVRGGGAFVCGEETALIASIEGKMGVPKPKPPYPAHSGLWAKPTNINNVETFANIPWIISQGAEAYARIGTEKSKGTKIFSLVGKINNTGLVEVPMGITLREIIYDIGGGIPKKRRFKAVQTGGPSGGCIPESLIDSPIDYDELTKIGSMMGSGGMVVLDERTCMVDVARYFLDFLKGESCGKCVPCRDGVWQMHEILTDICQGRGKESDIESLMWLCETIKNSALCGLGMTAPNPVLSTLRYFRDEYDSHIKDKRCPAGVCKKLVTYLIDDQKCNGCGLCKKNCPQEAIIGEKKQPHRIDNSKCTKCGICFEDCNFGAVVVK